MVKLNDAVLAETQLRHCPPFEPFAIGVRLSMWPLFQKEMNEHINAVKRVADSASGGILSKGSVKDSVLQDASNVPLPWYKT